MANPGAGILGGRWRRWRPVLALAALAAVYVGSEAALRGATYPPRGMGDAAEVERLISSLPPVAREWLVGRRKLRDMEAKLATTTDPGARVAAMYQLAGEDRGRRGHWLARILAEVPSSPLAARARAELLADQPRQAACEQYLEYLAACQAETPGERREIWEIGWSIAHGAPAPARLEFLRRLAAAAVVAPGLVDAFEELRGLAGRAGDQELLALARERHAACVELQRLELQQHGPRP